MRSVCVSFRLPFLVGLIIYPSLENKNHPPSPFSLPRLHLPVSLSLCANESFIWNWLAAFANSIWVQNSEISYWSQACVRTARMKERGFGAHHYSRESENIYIFSNDAHEVQFFRYLYFTWLFPVSVVFFSFRSSSLPQKTLLLKHPVSSLPFNSVTLWHHNTSPCN